MTTYMYRYMAPEMMCMIDNTECDRGYSKAIDWWSLGMLMVELLIGFNPFEKVNVDKFVSYYLSNVAPPEHARLLKDLKNFDQISSVCHDIINGLLETDGAKRLGSGANGLSDIKKHPIFGHINWVRLGQLAETPPYIPEEGSPDDVVYDCFDEMVLDLNRRPNRCGISPALNKYFDNWYVGVYVVLCVCDEDVLCIDEDVCVL